MTQEIVITSAPHGLKPGSRGFCTVMSTKGMAINMATQLEQLSGYRHVYPPPNPNADKNPVNYSHLVIQVANRKYHLLSRICDAGLDYSKRSNKLAHHVVIDEKELSQVPNGPAAIVLAKGFFHEAWDETETPQHIAAGSLREIEGYEKQYQGCPTWEKRTGDQGWAGVLAQSIVEKSGSIVVIFPPGEDMFPLVAEAIARLPRSKRWEATFSTYWTGLPPSIDCRWRFLVEGSKEANYARRDVRQTKIDLCQGRALPKADSSLWVEAARDGGSPEEELGKRENASSTVAQPSGFEPLKKMEDLPPLPDRKVSLQSVSDADGKHDEAGRRPNPPLPKVGEERKNDFLAERNMRRKKQNRILVVVLGISFFAILGYAMFLLGGGGEGEALQEPTTTPAQISSERDETQSPQVPDSADREPQVEAKGSADVRPVPPEKTEPRNPSRPQAVSINAPIVSEEPGFNLDEEEPREPFDDFSSLLELPPSSSEEEIVLGVVLDAKPGDLEIRFPDLKMILGEKFKFEPFRKGTADGDPKVWRIVREEQEATNNYIDVPIAEVQARSKGEDCEVHFSWLGDDPNYQKYKEAIRYGRMKLECTSDIDIEPKTIRFVHPRPTERVTETLDFRDSSITLVTFDLPEGLSQSAIDWDVFHWPPDYFLYGPKLPLWNEKLVLKDREGYVSIELSIVALNDSGSYACRAKAYTTLLPFKQRPQGQEGKDEWPKWPISRDKVENHLDELERLNRGNKNTEKKRATDNYTKKKSEYDKASTAKKTYDKPIETLEMKIKKLKNDIEKASGELKGDLKKKLGSQESKLRKQQKSIKDLDVEKKEKALNVAEKKLKKVKYELAGLDDKPRVEQVKDILAGLSANDIGFRIVLRLQDETPMQDEVSVVLVKSPAGGGDRP